MNNSYPAFQAWVQILNERDTGILFVSILALIAVIWLANARFFWPHLLPGFRTAAVWLFFLTAGASVIYFAVR